MAQRPKEEMRRAILAAAQAELASVGFEKTTLANVATRAGTSIGNVYKYFSGKEELFAAAVPDGIAVEFSGFQPHLFVRVVVVLPRLPWGSVGHDHLLTVDHRFDPVRLLPHPGNEVLVHRRVRQCSLAVLRKDGLLVVAEHDMCPRFTEKLDDFIRPAELEHRITGAEQLVDGIHELQRAAQACDVAVDIRNDADSHWRSAAVFAYSKMLVTTSSMLRCTSRSSVSAQVIATWQARRAGTPWAMSLPA